MKSITSKIITLISSAFILGLAFAGAPFHEVSAQNYTEPTTAPTALPSGSTPQENFYHFIVSAPIGGSQVKIGKLGLNEEPLPQYDFRSDGLASFLGGAWASSGSFARNVCIGQQGFSSTGPCPAGSTLLRKLEVNGEFISQGQAANIQNETLRHTTVLPNGEPGLQRVCSNNNGYLRLCNMPELSGLESLANICSQFPEYYGCSILSATQAPPIADIGEVDTSGIPGQGTDFGVADSTGLNQMLLSFCDDPANANDPICGGSEDGSSGRPSDDTDQPSQRSSTGTTTQDLMRLTSLFADTGELTSDGQAVMSQRLTDATGSNRTDDSILQTQNRADQGFFDGTIDAIENIFRRPQRFYKNQAREQLSVSAVSQSSEKADQLDQIVKDSTPLINNRETETHRALQQHVFDVSGARLGINDILDEGAALDCNSGPVTCNPPYCNSYGENHHYVGTTNAAGTVCNLSIGMDQNDDAYPLLLDYIANN